MKKILVMCCITGIFILKGELEEPLAHLDNSLALLANNIKVQLQQQQQKDLTQVSSTTIQEKISKVAGSNTQVTKYITNAVEEYEKQKKESAQSSHKGSSTTKTVYEIAADTIQKTIASYQVDYSTEIAKIEKFKKEIEAARSKIQSLLQLEQEQIVLSQQEEEDLKSKMMAPNPQPFFSNIKKFDLLVQNTLREATLLNGSPKPPVSNNAQQITNIISNLQSLIDLLLKSTTLQNIQKYALKPRLSQVREIFDQLNNYLTDQTEQLTTKQSQNPKNLLKELTDQFVAQAVVLITSPYKESYKKALDTIIKKIEEQKLVADITSYRQAVSLVTALSEKIGDVIPLLTILYDKAPDKVKLANYKNTIQTTFQSAQSIIVQKQQEVHSTLEKQILEAIVKEFETKEKKLLSTPGNLQQTLEQELLRIRPALSQEENEDSDDDDSDDEY